FPDPLVNPDLRPALYVPPLILPSVTILIPHFPQFYSRLNNIPAPNHTHRHTDKHTHTDTRTQSHTHRRSQSHTHTHTHTHTQSHTHTHPQPHTHTRRQHD